MLQEYYRLAKPGIIYGNILTAAGSFLFASAGDIKPGLLLAALLGIGLVIASACVFNNVLDRDIDARMVRTKKRALVSGQVSVKSACLYGLVLAIAGLAILALGTNATTLNLGIIGFVTYVGAYTHAKRHTVYSTLIGTIPGAMPIAAGYTAVSGQFDGTALILFIILIIWQLPHFYAIAMFRREDYAAASIPVVSVVSGQAQTRKYIIVTIICLLPAVLALTIYGPAGWVYAGLTAGYTSYWLIASLLSIKKRTDFIPWARKVFGNSLIFLLIFSLTLSLDAWLP